jgi:signal transduction histidine kinase
MNLERRRARPRLAHTARVAGVVALVFSLVYTLVTVSFDVLDTRHLVSQVDAQVADRLGDVIALQRSGRLKGARISGDRDVDDAPVMVWRVAATGAATALTYGAPGLPLGTWSRTGEPTTTRLNADDFRLIAAPSGDDWIVAGQSLTTTEHVEKVVDLAELVAGPVLVLAVFLGALTIGLMASRPVELARRRQLEFTADASHELRTPLSVIEAEVGLALSSWRDGAGYRDTLQRVRTEGQRLRHIVEDLLFLARFDSQPPPPGDDLVDLATLAAASVERFSAVAQAKDIQLSVTEHGSGDLLIKAPAAWVDRLCGVLVDNACRYATPGGSVHVLVAARAGTVTLAVEDDGPGIPPEERPLLFDRFHRGTEQGGGAGLGLAIADAVVRSTGGKWRVGEAPGGGAHMEVSWRRQTA